MSSLDEFFNHIPEKKDLFELLEDWAVMEDGIWENNAPQELEGWVAVANTEGIVAYFGKSEDAFRFRLSEINRILNG